MPTLTIEAQVREADADDVFRRIRDFASYPRYTDAVRSVVVRPIDESTSESEWAVNFRNGVMCWTERDHAEPIARRLTFEQIEGDYETFRGTWTVVNGSAVTIVFHCEFDLGMPSIEAMINALARDAFIDNLTLILKGLYPESTVVTWTTA